MGRTGASSMGDYPHGRYYCPRHPFLQGGSVAQNSLHCQNCWCYVCDVFSGECDAWESHCGAWNGGPWKAMRQSVRAGGPHARSPPPAAFAAPRAPAPVPGWGVAAPAAPFPTVGSNVSAPSLRARLLICRCTTLHSWGLFIALHGLPPFSQGPCPDCVRATIPTDARLVSSFTIQLCMSDKPVAARMSDMGHYGRGRHRQECFSLGTAPTIQQVRGSPLTNRMRLPRRHGLSAICSPQAPSPSWC